MVEKWNEKKKYIRIGRYGEEGLWNTVARKGKR